MRWFKHYNNAADGGSFENLIAEKDFETAYIYWWLLEQVSKYEDKSNPALRGRITLNFSVFKRKLGLNLQRTQRVLLKIAKTFTLEIKLNLDESIEVFVPKWLELQENRGSKTHGKIVEKSLKNTIEERSKNKDLEERERGVSPELHPLILIWNSAKDLSKVKLTNKKREQKISLVWPQIPADQWRLVVEKIDQSNFCTGNNNTGWKATFDWILQPDTYMKVLEGKYDNGKGNNPNKPKGYANQRADQATEFESIATGANAGRSNEPV